MNTITFTCTQDVQPEFYPEPAKKSLPKWYKEMQSYVGGKKEPTDGNNTSATIKKCIPVFDSMTAGYILKTPCDIYVREKEGAPYYEWPSFDFIEFHPIEQAPTHPKNDGFAYPKFINPWSVKTPKGYSCLFIHPLHRESVFTILPGIVDTDTYHGCVNFPFTLNDPKFTGLIPAGTPMAQVIPFKRDKWSINVIKDFRNGDNVTSLQRLRIKIFDGYKTLFWQKKEFN